MYRGLVDNEPVGKLDLFIGLAGTVAGHTRLTSRVSCQEAGHSGLHKLHPPPPHPCPSNSR
jgi:hypothetical protein